MKNDKEKKVLKPKKKEEEKTILKQHVPGGGIKTKPPKDE